MLPLPCRAWRCAQPDALPPAGIDMMTPTIYTADDTLDPVVPIPFYVVGQSASGCPACKFVC